jgi:hypothetical protein
MTAPRVIEHETQFEQATRNDNNDRAAYHVSFSRTHY